MTVEIHPVHLFDVKRRESVEAELVYAIMEQQLADWEAEWIPALFDAIRCL